MALIRESPDADRRRTITAPTTPSLVSSLWDQATQAAPKLYRPTTGAPRPMTDAAEPIMRQTSAPPPAAVEAPAANQGPAYPPIYAGGASSGSGGSSGSGYNGMSFDEYKQKLVDQVKGGITSEFEANASIVRNNIATALSNLDAEKAALDPLYQTQLKGIKQREFATSLQQRELMNQSGWNGVNSGLAIGEQTRVKNEANEQTSEATEQFNQFTADIMRRKTLAETTGNEQLASLEIQKNAKLSGAEAAALIQAEDRNRQIFESDRGFAESVRQWQSGHNLDVTKYNQSVSQYYQSRQDASAAQKAQDAKDNTGFSKAEIDNMTTSAFSQIMAASNIGKDPMVVLDKLLASNNFPTAVKTSIIAMLQSHKDLKNSGTGLGSLNFNTNTSGKQQLK